jgi:serine/threonine protein kinase
MSDHRNESRTRRGNSTHSLTVDEVEAIDRRCDLFEAAWRDGESPRHEDQLTGEGAFRAALEAELIAVELDWRRRSDEILDAPMTRARDLLASADSSGAEPIFASKEGILDSLATRIGELPHVMLRDTDGGPEPPLYRPNFGADLGSGIRYRIDGEIARGGMGAVLKGRDPDLGRDVALKVLREDFRDNVEMVRRFVEEAQIGGQLQHPGIVPIYEIGTFSDRRPFFSMKLVKGDTLAKILTDRKDLSDGLPRYLAIFQSIAQTVAYSHARGVIHRDLKPSNVMVGSFGEVQVMDWGLAKVLSRGGVVDDAEAGKLPEEDTVIATARSGADDSDLSRAGSVMGTPSYMAPEQARGEIDQIDERADVFALGSILCEILTGKPAFTGRTSIEIQRKAALGDTTDAFNRLDASGADAELIALANNCLAREPEDRPRTASHVADRLTAYLVGVQERLRRAELESVEERARRRLTTVTAAALILLTLFGGGTYAWNQQQKADRLAKTSRAVDEALAEASRLRGEALSAPAGDSGRWLAAFTAAKRAEGLLAQGDAIASLKDRVDTLMDQVQREQAAAAEKARQIEVDRVLLGELETVRGNRVAHRNPKRSDVEYAAVFRKAGLDLDATESEKAGKWLSSRTDPVEMAGYLDDWAFVRRMIGRGEADWLRLVKVARGGDPDPWRDVLRAKFGKNDDETMTEFHRMAELPRLEDQPPAGLLLLARQLKFACNDGLRAAQVLRRGARRYPGDFRIHFELAQAPGSVDGISDDQFPYPEEAFRHLTTALGIRPQSVSTHVVLGVALIAFRRLEEAEAECREAIRLKPDESSAHTQLGNVLRWELRPDEAEIEAREGVRLNPGLSLGHNILGIVLRDEWKFDEAVVELSEAIRIDPEKGPYNDLIGGLQAQGNYARALSVYRSAVESGVKIVPNHFTPPEWFARIEPRVALAARIPAIIKGEDAPKDLGERLELAQMCYDMKRTATAAGFWGEAMELEPSVGESRRPLHRFNAACSAAVSGSGRGRDDPAPDEVAKARFRSLALDWLRLELGWWSRYLESGQPNARPVVLSHMNHWKNYRELAGIRNADALARLPEAERKDWQAFWAEVDALARKSGELKPK